MSSDPRIRASDQDRDRTADMLREHHAVGRLDPTEFQDRLDRVFEAKTIGDLDELTADLPAIDLYPLPTSSLRRGGRSGGGSSASMLDAVGRGLARGGRLSPAWVAAWGSWFCVTLLCTVIWLLAGTGYPWPLWVAGPWGAVLAGRWIMGAGPGGRGGGSSSGGGFGGDLRGGGGRGEIGHGQDEADGPQDPGQ